MHTHVKRQCVFCRGTGQQKETHQTRPDCGDCGHGLVGINKQRRQWKMVLAVDTHAAQGWSPVAEGRGQHLAWLVGWALLWKAPPGSVEAALGVTGKVGKPRSPSRLGSAHPQHSKSLGAVSLSQLGHEIIRTSRAWARAAPGSPSETRTVTSHLCRPDSRVPTAPEASPSVLSCICSFPPHQPQAQSGPPQVTATASVWCG